MKDKKHKHLEYLLEEYLLLQEEDNEVDSLIEKFSKKFKQNLSNDAEAVYNQADAEDLYKIFIALKRHEDRKTEIKEEFNEVEELVKAFLIPLNGGKVLYEKKDDNDKSKSNLVFWLENNQVKCEKQ